MTDSEQKAKRADQAPDLADWIENVEHDFKEHIEELKSIASNYGTFDAKGFINGQLKFQSPAEILAADARHAFLISPGGEMSKRAWENTVATCEELLQRNRNERIVILEAKLKAMEASDE